MTSQIENNFRNPGEVQVYPNGSGSKTQPSERTRPAMLEQTGQGEIYSHTTIYNPPAGFEHQVPYTVALVKLPEGPLVTAQLTDIDVGDVEIGKPVEIVTRKLCSDEAGQPVYGYKFRPPIADPKENTRSASQARQHASTRV